MLRPAVDSVGPTRENYYMKQINMIPGTVEMVPVEWVLKNANSSVDGFEDEDNGGVDYEAMVCSKGTEDIGPLIGNIVEHGFRIPIVLCLSAWLGQTYITHGDGHHRFVAALLLCLDEIPVYWSDGDYMALGSTGALQSLEFVDEAWDEVSDYLLEALQL